MGGRALKLAINRILIVLLLAVGACADNREAARPLSRADTLLERLHKAGDFSGAVIIGRDGVIIYEGAFGVADQTRPFTPDTAADGGSLAKTVTATLIWGLIDKGRIALDDPVQTHVAEFPYAEVTVEHLLSHTSGAPDYDPFQPLPDAAAAIGNVALPTFMRQISPRPLRQPGKTFSYCNACYDTLALLTENVTGSSYEEQIGRLLGGIGAGDAFLRPAQFTNWPQQRTLGFRSSLPGAEAFDVFDNEAIYGGSNIYFSARDLHAWASAWADGRVLPEAVIDNAMSPARVGDDASALSLASWYCAPARERCYYTGHHQAFFNLVYWDSSRRISVVFVSNNTMAPPLQPWLMRSLVAIAEGREAEPQPHVPLEETETDAKALSGRYRLPGIGDVEISKDEAGPTVRTGRGPRYQLYQVGYGILYAPGVDAYLSFLPAENGSSPTLIWTSVFKRAEGRRLA
jgi:CubicO group peptidase (beta-lactamase class C family)